MIICGDLNARRGSCEDFVNCILKQCKGFNVTSFSWKRRRFSENSQVLVGNSIILTSRMILSLSLFYPVLIYRVFIVLNRAKLIIL